jgi:hypothetical protein
MQGRSSAEYLSYVFKTPVVLLIHSRDSYGLSFLKGFAEGYDKDKLITRGFDVGPDLRGESLRTAVEAAASDREPGQQFSFWWTGVRPKGHTGLEKDWAAILGRLGLIQGRDGGARQPAERRAALL